MAGFTGAYIAGCLYAWVFHGVSMVWLWMAGLIFFIFCGILYFFFQKTADLSDRRYYFLFPICFLLAGWNMGEALDLSTAWQQEGEMAVVFGVVEKKERKAASDAVILENGWVYQIKTDDFPNKGNDKKQKEKSPWNAGSGKLLVYIEKNEEIFSGDTIWIQGDTAFLAKAGNPGQFDMEQYYKNKGIASMLYGKSVEKKAQGFWLFRYIDRFRSAWIDFYENALPEDEAGIVISMLLGEKAYMDTEVKERYQRCGIAHILAISGLHISLLGMSLYRILLASGRYRQTACIVTILFLVFYGIFTGFSVSATRAILMALVMLSGEILGYAYDLLSGLSFAALCILIPAPMQLFDMGFQLSFLAVVGIAVFYPGIKNVLLCWEAEREEDARKKGRQLWYEKRKTKRQQMGKGLKQGRKCLLAFCDMLCSSFFLNLFTAPVLLWHSYEVSSYGFFLNLLILPFVSLLLGLSVVGGAVGLLWSSAGIFLMGGVHVILGYYDHLCVKIGQWPGALWIMGRPSMLRMSGAGVCIAFLFLMFFLWKKTGIGRKFLRFLSVAALMGVVLFLFIPRDREGFGVTMLDVGQGDAICLQMGEICCMLDGGSSSEKEIGKYILTPYLDYQGIRMVDYWLFSHMDEDHTSGFLELIKDPYFQKRVKNVVFPKLSMKDDAFEEMEAAARQAGCRVLYFSKGDAMVFGGGKITLSCLFPEDGKEYPDRNDASMVLALRYGGFSALFMGDLGKEGEERLLQLGGLPEKITLLKAGHHGSKTSSCESFLRKESPEVTFVSCGEKNRYGHPHAETIARFGDIGTRIYQSRECGAVTVKAAKDTKGSAKEGMWLEIETFREIR